MGVRETINTLHSSYQTRNLLNQSFRERPGLSSNASNNKRQPIPGEVFGNRRRCCGNDGELASLLRLPGTLWHRARAALHNETTDTLISGGTFASSPQPHKQIGLCNTACLPACQPASTKRVSNVCISCRGGCINEANALSV